MHKGNLVGVRPIRHQINNGIPKPLIPSCHAQSEITVLRVAHYGYEKYVQCASYLFSAA